MKVLGISGSPRKEGNTEILVKKALDVAEVNGAEVEFIGLAGKDIKGCIACPDCGKGEKCVIDDDIQAIYPKMEGADAIILGTPIYFGQMTAQTKTLMDRTYFLHKSGGKLRGKVGGVITVGGRAGHDFTAVALMEWFTLLGMLLPGNSFAESMSREKGAAIYEENAVKAVESLAIRMINLKGKL
jgi:multimeric flavodoxin WrbA